jgi:hypothetical protein
LSTDERKIAAELEKKSLEFCDEGSFEIGLAVLVLQVQEFENVRLLDFLLRRDDIVRRRHLTLAEHRRLVSRQSCALIKLAANLAVELANGPATAKRFRLVEVASFGVSYREQPYVVRPGQIESCRNGIEVGGRSRLSRQRLECFQPVLATGKSRHSLDNVAISQEERLHLKEVGAAEAPSEPSLQVARKADDNFFAIVGPSRTSLLLLHNTAADRPVRGGHHGVHGARNGTASRLYEVDNIGQHSVVAMRAGPRKLRLLLFHRRQECRDATLGTSSVHKAWREVSPAITEKFRPLLLGPPPPRPSPPDAKAQEPRPSPPWLANSLAKAGESAAESPL